MVRTLKASLTAIMLSSVAVVPIATISFVGSADAAFAKSEKSRGGERGKPSEAGPKSKGKSGQAGAQRGKSAKILGESKAKGGPKAAVAEEGEIVFHPSQLGNMNGAMNANINAVLAHIRNGNSNGPVGHLAALATSDVNAVGDQNIIDRWALFSALEGSPYATVDDYYAALDGNQPIEAIDTAVDKEAAAISEGFGSYQDYLDYLAEPPAERDDAIDTALADLGYSVDDRDVVDETAPSQGEYDQAVLDLADQKAAEDDILAYWNKNPGGEGDEFTGRTPEEEQLLADLRERLEASAEDIEEAVTSTQPATDACDPETEVCGGDDV